MDARKWTVCIVEPNKFEAQIMADLLRAAGCQRIRVFHDATEAMGALEGYAADVVIASFDLDGTDGAAWTRTFRRNKRLLNRKASVFLTSHAFSRMIAEQCRHAGANALIGKPVSGKSLLSTIDKVLTKPRPFIDNQGEGYVGPCRRAGIVTTAAPRGRRRADVEIESAAHEGPSLQQLTADLTTAANGLISGGAVDACTAALNRVQEFAVAAGDGPLMRACAAFSLHLSTPGLRPDALNAGVQACVDGVAKLAAIGREDASGRDAVVETMRQAVAKAALQKARAA